MPVFQPQNWAVLSQSSNIPQRTLQDGSIIGAPGEYTYQDRNSTLAEMSSDVTLFSVVDNTLAAGDLIYIVGSDASAEFTVLQVDPDTRNVIIAQESGAGNVIGPGSATDNAVVRFNGTTGKIVQNSLAILSDDGVLSGLTGLISAGITYPTNSGAPAGSHMVYDGAGQLTLEPVGGGGDVFGPASAVDNRLVRFDDTSGKLIQNSSAALSDGGALTGLTGLVSDGATIAGLNYPGADGAPGYIMTTDGAGNLTLQPDGSSSGDVVGPASATNNALVRFDSTTGKLIKNSAGILDDAGALTGLSELTVYSLRMYSSAPSIMTMDFGNSHVQFDTSDHFTFNPVGGSFFDTDLTIVNSSQVIFLASGSPNQVGFRLKTNATLAVVYNLPTVPPVTGQFLSATTPAGSESNLVWATPPSGGGFTSSVITTGTPVTAVNLTRYIANSSSLVNITLPASPTVNDEYQIMGLGSGGWKVTIGATNQIIRQGISSSISTTTGSMASTNQYDDVTLVCVAVAPAVYKAIPNGVMTFT